MARKPRAIQTRGSNKMPRRRTCATMGVHYQLLEMHSGFRQRQVSLERRTEKMKSMGVDEFEKMPIRVIPVVVHVVYRTERENISDSQIESQIAALNRDFRATNADRTKIPAVFRPLHADVRVEFELAQTDPEGQTTTGITRTKTEVRSFPPDDSVKFSGNGGADPWPTDRYLNMWVCNLGQSLLGYAQFPGGPPRTDG
ncbi:MAG: zinc metalloprotease, partial [Acidimicrobiia bacterium]|nr:zinc metalloprotease [Acidimicrobiia bacterium]